MENSGVMTFRTSKLLCNKQWTSSESKERIGDAVLHEISHQWLGNLVTMARWTQLWLKEGLATLMAWYARDCLFPDHHVWPCFIIEVQQVALELDYLRTSHPLEIPCVSTEEVSQIFDHVSYKKGASILRMLLKAIGPEAFFNGIRDYVKLHQFGSASSNDLWKAFQTASPKGKMRETMQIWTTEQGFSVVKIIVDQDQAHIFQTRFLPIEGSECSQEQTTYPLLISFRSRSSLQEFELHQEHTTIPISGDTVFEINADNTGFFRTLYSSTHLRRLGAALKKGWLSIGDRIGLIADTTTLAQAGLQDIHDLYDLLISMKDDDNYCVWRQIIKSLQAVRMTWIFEEETTSRLMHFCCIGLQSQALGP